MSTVTEYVLSGPVAGSNVNVWYRMALSLPTRLLQSIRGQQAYFAGLERKRRRCGGLMGSCERHWRQSSFGDHKVDLRIGEEAVW